MNAQQTVTPALTRRLAIPGFTWRVLLRTAAICDIAAMVIVGIILPDRLPLGLAVVIGIGLELLHWRSGLLGEILLGVIFADTTFWTAGAAFSNALYGEELIRLAVPAILGAISAAGLVAAGASVLYARNREAGRRAAPAVALAAIALFGGMFIAGLMASESQAQAAAASGTVLNLSIQNLAYSTRELTANNGQVTVTVDNHDVWWHTFTIDGLNVNLSVPSSGKRQITFKAKPGVYTYYCGIPGHRQLGMTGTLIVH